MITFGSKRRHNQSFLGAGRGCSHWMLLMRYVFILGGPMGSADAIFGGRSLSLSRGLAGEPDQGPKICIPCGGAAASGNGWTMQESVM